MEGVVTFSWVWHREHPWVRPCKLVGLDCLKLNFKLLGRKKKKHNTDVFRRAIVFWCYNSVCVFQRVSFSVLLGG